MGITTNGMSRMFTFAEIRLALKDHGFERLCQIDKEEHWVRDGRRLTLVHIHDYSRDDDWPEAMLYAYAIGDHGQIRIDVE
jgi:hypothetical protein